LVQRRAAQLLRRGRRAHSVRAPQDDSIPEGTGPYVESHPGRTVMTAQDPLAAATPPRVEREQLPLEEPAPVLEVQYTVWDADDQPMTFEVNIVPADRWSAYEYPVVGAGWRHADFGPAGLGSLVGEAYRRAHLHELLEHIETRGYRSFWKSNL
jgi:hypothetical protein